MRTLALGLGLVLSAVVASPAHAQYVPPPAPVAGQEYAPVAGQEYAPYEAYQGQAPQGLWTFNGAHPIGYDQGGGFCTLSGAHQHPYPVFDEHLFRLEGGGAYFIGDPGDFGYAQAPYQYVGAHPIDVRFGGGYCHMGWGHRHAFAPAGVGYAMRGGAYYYGGGFAPRYYAERAAYQPYYAGYYRNNYLGGRYYQVRPQHVYAGVGRTWRAMFAPHQGGGRFYGRPAYRPSGGGHFRGRW